MNNIFQLLQMAQSSGNPQSFMINMLKNNNNNPMLMNILNLAQNNDYESIENIAKNILKEQGLNFDVEFQKFKSQLGIK